MKILTRVLALIAGISGVLPVVPAHAAAERKPNILVILADDLGFSDIGCYGSEIATPTLDRLAANGLRFSQFYNTAKCHSSRVSLLTGRWSRQAGEQEMSHAITLPEVLSPAGYFTAISGKWHLAGQPTDYGFQRAFGHLSGATNYYKGDASFRLNGKPWQVPAEGFYTTVANVDYAIRFIDEARQEKKPWFVYLAFNAPHAPLQPLKEDYERYLGKYDAGWDVMRAARVAKLRQSGVLGKEFTESPRPGHVPAWDSLKPQDRAWEARRMAAYAALIDRLDREIGRLVGNLERAGELDNTVIVFASDNGACPFDRNSTSRNQQPYLPETRWSDSTGWAWARNTPFRFYKQNQYEGGIATPAIVHWPAGLKTRPGSVVDAPAHLVDLLPTFAEITGAPIPNAMPGRTPTPLAGISLARVFAGQPLGSRPAIHLMFGRDRGLRDGDWKLVDFQGGPWELYNLASDRTEIHDVAARHPELVKRMSAQWFDMARNVLRATERETAPVTAQTAKSHPQWTDFSASDEDPAKRRERRRARRAEAETEDGE